MDNKNTKTEIEKAKKEVIEKLKNRKVNRPNFDDKFEKAYLQSLKK